MDTGVTTNDVQLAICNGTYGGRTWSDAERAAACERYEALTADGATPESSYGLMNVGALIGVIFLVTLFAIVIYDIFKRRKLERLRIRRVQRRTK